MTKYLAGVLSVIAVGVLLVAYGLLNPRNSMDASTLGMASSAPMAAMAGPVAARGPAYGSDIVYVPVSQAQGLTQPAYVPVNYVPQQGYAPVSAPVTFSQPASRGDSEPRAVRTASYTPSAPARPVRTQSVERAPGRDWKKTALIIGGSSATGAGVGALFGGKKGALIGAAIGGGASTIYEVTK